MRNRSVTKTMPRNSVWTHPHGEVVAPRQKHYSSVVFLNMSQIEVQEDIPDHKEHTHWRQIIGPKQGEHVDGYQDRWVRVQTVIEKLSQGTTATCTSGLFTVHTIYYTYNKNTTHPHKNMKAFQVDWIQRKSTNNDSHWKMLFNCFWNLNYSRARCWWQPPTIPNLVSDSSRDWPP